MLVKYKISVTLVIIFIFGLSIPLAFALNEWSDARGVQAYEDTVTEAKIEYAEKRISSDKDLLRIARRAQTARDDCNSQYGEACSFTKE